MAARRCSIDGISFPADYRFSQCPICKETTSYFSNVDPDDGWENAVVRLQERLAGAAAEAPDIPHVNARVIARNDRLWIHSWDVYHSGLRYRLKDGQLVQIGKQTFEILGYDEPARLYLVRAFATELSTEDLAKLAGP